MNGKGNGRGKGENKGGVGTQNCSWKPGGYSRRGRTTLSLLKGAGAGRIKIFCHFWIPTELLPFLDLVFGSYRTKKTKNCCRVSSKCKNPVASLSNCSLPPFLLNYAQNIAETTFRFLVTHCINTVHEDITGIFGRIWRKMGKNLGLLAYLHGESKPAPKCNQRQFCVYYYCKSD